MTKEGNATVQIIIGVSGVDTAGILKRVIAKLEPELTAEICVLAIGNSVVETDDERVVSIARPSSSVAAHDSVAVWNAVTQFNAAFGVAVDAQSIPNSSGWLDNVLEQMRENNLDLVLPAQSVDALTQLTVAPLVSSLYGQRTSCPVPSTYAFTANRAKSWLKLLASNEHQNHHPVLCATLHSLAHERSIAESPFFEPMPVLPSEDDPRFGRSFTQVLRTVIDHAVADKHHWQSVRAVRPNTVLNGISSDSNPEERNAHEVNEQLLVDRFTDASGIVRDTWGEWLAQEDVEAISSSMHGDKAGISPSLWAHLTFSALKEVHANPQDENNVISSLLPLYFGRVIDELQSPSSFEERIESFQQLKAKFGRHW